MAHHDFGMALAPILIDKISFCKSYRFVSIELLGESVFKGGKGRIHAKTT